MGIQSGIPFDLLFFIMAMVIMFVAAPGLIRTIWRVRVGEAGAGDRLDRAHRTGRAGMTATVVASVPQGEGLAARRALRDARVRGGAFLVIGVALGLRGVEHLRRPGVVPVPDRRHVVRSGSMWRRRSASCGSSPGSLPPSWASSSCGVARRSDGGRWLLVADLPVHRRRPRGTAGRHACDDRPACSAARLELATPLTLGALAGILSERSGMLNIALEGKMLVGACVRVRGRRQRRSRATGDVFVATIVGVSAAMLASGLLGLLLAWLGIRHKVDQIIAGTVINIGAIGITNFLFLRVLGSNPELNTPPTSARCSCRSWPTFRCSARSCSRLRPYVYVTVILIAFLTYMIYRTRWGLRLRASGEKPAAAGTVGINVMRIRYRALLLAGLIAGLAGSYLSLSTAGSFQMEMVAGRGLHRARRGHLRRLASDRSVRRGPRLRLRRLGAVAPALRPRRSDRARRSS